MNAGGRLCVDCGNVYYGRECDLCAPMARTFARLQQQPRVKSKKTKNRDWHSGVDAAVPPEKD
jgi:hypothetical protein